MNTLAQCPHCGHQPDEANLLDSIHSVMRDRSIWTAGCIDNEGGCNASVLGDSREDAIAKWNRRVLAGEPDGIQACREGDRAMLATPAGAELINAVTAAMAGERQSLIDRMKPDGWRAFNRAQSCWECSSDKEQVEGKFTEPAEAIYIESTIREAEEQVASGAPEGWREDIDLAAQMLTWGMEEGLDSKQEIAVREHQRKLFAMLSAAPAPPPAQSVDE